MSERRLSDDALVELLDEALASPGPGDAFTGACPADALYWDMVRGALDPDELGRLLEHARNCGSCWTALRVARETFAESGLPRERPRVGRQEAGWRALFRPAPALAILALFAVVVPAYLHLSRRPTAAEFREPEGGALRLLVPEGATLPRDRFLLRWESDTPGAAYAVVLTTTDLQEVHSRRGLAATEVTVPAEALAHLPPGTQLAWRVDAVLPDGTHRSSPARFVRIGDPAP